MPSTIISSSENTAAKRREAWALGLFIRLFRAGETKRAVLVNRYSPQIHSEANRRLFNLLIGETEKADVDEETLFRFKRLVGDFVVQGERPKTQGSAVGQSRRKTVRRAGKTRR